MTTPDAAPGPHARGLAREAARLDGVAPPEAVIAAWTAALDADPAWPLARVGLAQALLRAGRALDALPHLERACAQAPAAPAAALAHAVALSELGRHADAVAAAGRAAALAPAIAAVHAGRGDVLRRAGRDDEATGAYRRAVELAPSDADALNKLASSLLARRELGDAAALLDRALAFAPAHPHARVNRATLAIWRGRFDDARSDLERVLRDRASAADARDEAAAILRRIEASQALDAVLDAAVDRGDPSLVADALRAAGPVAEAEPDLLRFLEPLVSRAATTGSQDERFPPRPSDEAAWQVREADDNALPQEGLARDDDALVRGDRAAYAALVPRRAVLRASGDAIAGDAALRWAHRSLARHRADHAAGRFKVVANRVQGSAGVLRVTPDRTAGSVRAVLGDLAPRFAAGAMRAAFLQFALGAIHPFQDGNGRVLRMLVNAELEAAGLHPGLAGGAEGRLALRAAYEVAIAQRDLAPIVDWLADASRRGAEVARS